MATAFRHGSLQLHATARGSAMRRSFNTFGDAPPFAFTK
jgi:hypothetical protein